MNQDPNKNSTSWVMWMILVPLLLLGALIATCIEGWFH